jgi:hypothetical protein
VAWDRDIYTEAERRWYHICGVFISGRTNFNEPRKSRMDELKACLMRIYRKADIMRMDAKSPTVKSDAEEIRILAQITMRKLENLNDEPIPPADGRCRED